MSNKQDHWDAFNDRTNSIDDRKEAMLRLVNVGLVEIDIRGYRPHPGETTPTPPPGRPRP